MLNLRDVSLGNPGRFAPFALGAMVLALSACSGDSSDPTTDVMDQTDTDNVVAVVEDAVEDSARPDTVGQDGGVLDTIDDSIDPTDLGITDDTTDPTDTFVGEDTAPWTPPDPSFFHVVREQAVTVEDTPFLEEYPTWYQFDPSGVVGLSVHAMAVVDGHLWIGTGNGIWGYDSDIDDFSEGNAGSATFPIQAIAKRTFNGQVVMAYPGGWALVDPDGTVETENHVTELEINSVEVINNIIWFATKTGLYSGDGGEPEFVAGGPSSNVLDVDGNGSFVVAVSNVGTFIYNNDRVSTIEPADAVSVVLHHDDTFLLARPDGLTMLNAATEEVGPEVLPGKGALPAGHIMMVSAQMTDGVDGMFMVGHARGATVATVTDSSTKFDHYVSRRWIPQDEVTAIALDADGSRWVGTANGVARIRLRETTLHAKAEAMFDELNDKFWRLDFIASDVYADDPFNPTTFQTHDKDNDGLWTQMGIGALCYAFTVTGEDRYRTAAQRAMQMMYRQIDIPAVSFMEKGMSRGFITRSLVRDDEGDVFTSKATQSNWHLVEDYDGHDWYWKDDTSSDETTGHFYGFPLYYDLCATEDEKAALVDHVGALAGYIQDGGWTLVDLDGEATSWGHWEPSKVSGALDGLEACMIEVGDFDTCAMSAYGGGWLNGNEILGHMLAAYHITGDERFYRGYETLIREHRYDEAATFNEEVFTVTNPAIANHSDHELAMLAYQSLIRYEADDVRRQQWIDSLVAWYQYEIPEHQPLWAAYVALAVPGEAEVEAAVQTLREYPLDLREWYIDNSHRKDCSKWPNDRHGDEQWDTVFPYDEICSMWWNGNPYVMYEGGDGRSLNGPVAFLLAYWAQRYAGILTE